MPALVLAILLPQVIALSPAASAAESIPDLQYPAIEARSHNSILSSPGGNVTLSCTGASAGSRLVTYGPNGATAQQIAGDQIIDGEGTCIPNPAIGKDGMLYGIPFGKNSNGTYIFGHNLHAYKDGSLRWKYPVRCGAGTNPEVAVGANNIVYTLNWTTDGMHLIGLQSDPPTEGQTPTKVFDVKVGNDCGSRLFPYKDGVVLSGQLNSTSYYNNAGKLLGKDMSTGDFWNLKVNAEGRMFTQNYNGQQRFIGTYDPLLGYGPWSYRLLDGTDFRGLHPTPNGGIVAYINEPLVDGGGIPIGKVEKLLVLDAIGQKVRELSLPPTDDYGNWYGDTMLRTDTAGKVAVVRRIYQRTSLSYPQTVTALAISVIDPLTGTVNYSQLMSGDLQKPYGYQLSQGPVITDGIFAFTGGCTHSCINTNLKLFAIKVPGLGMDYPRGAVLDANTPSQPPPIDYAALGDSYSSAQGAGRYDEGTVMGSNTCHRSWNAYARAASRNPYSPLSLSSFVACGGATTAVITQKWSGGKNQSEPPQNSALSGSTRAVSITIGGNDIGFADVIETCADPLKDCDGAINLAHSKMGILEVNLQAVYLNLLLKAPQAKVYVIGYPPIIAPGPGCLVGGNQSDYPFYSENRKLKAMGLLNALNAKISASVDEVRSLGTNYERLRYINPMAPGSPFIGHDVCASEPYFNGLVLGGDVSESFHPNKSGQAAYAKLLMDAVIG